MGHKVVSGAAPTRVVQHRLPQLPVLLWGRARGDPARRRTGEGGCTRGRTRVDGPVQPGGWDNTPWNRGRGGLGRGRRGDQHRRRRLYLRTFWLGLGEDGR